jgi:hypothetical protein
MSQMGVEYVQTGREKGQWAPETGYCNRGPRMTRYEITCDLLMVSRVSIN